MKLTTGTSGESSSVAESNPLRYDAPPRPVEHVDRQQSRRAPRRRTTGNTRSTADTDTSRPVHVRVPRSPCTPPAAPTRRWPRTTSPPVISATSRSVCRPASRSASASGSAVGGRSPPGVDRVDRVLQVGRQLRRGPRLVLRVLPVLRLHVLAVAQQNDDLPLRPGRGVEMNDRQRDRVADVRARRPARPSV